MMDELRQCAHSAQMPIFTSCFCVSSLALLIPELVKFVSKLLVRNGGKLYSLP